MESGGTVAQQQSVPHHLESVSLNTEKQLPKLEGKHCCGLEQSQTFGLETALRATGSACRSTNKQKLSLHLLLLVQTAAKSSKGPHFKRLKFECQ